MKSLTHLVLVVLITAIAATGAASAKAAKIDFSEFAGKYKGTWVITVVPTTAATAVTLDVKVNKTGTDMTLDLSGILAVSGQTVPIQATYKFKAKNRKLVASSPLLGFVGPAATLPLRFGGSKNNFTFTTVAAPGATLLGSDISGSVTSYSLKFSPKKLTIIGNGLLVVGGTPQAVQFAVTLTKKKSAN